MKYIAVLLLFMQLHHQNSAVVVVSLKSNILWVGVENPLEALIENSSQSSIHLATDNGTINELEHGKNRFVIVPANVGMTKIYVYKKHRRGNVLIDSVFFRATQLSPPTAFIGMKKGGAIDKRMILAIGAVIAKLEDSDICASFRVIDYRVIALRDSSVVGISFNGGNRFNEKTKTLIGQLRNGDNLLFASIRVIGVDGKELITTSREYVIIE